MSYAEILRGNKEEIIQWYIEDRDSVSLIASRLEVSDSALRQYLSRENITLKSKPSDRNYSAKAQNQVEATLKDLYKIYDFDAYLYVTEGRGTADSTAGAILVYDPEEIGGLTLRRAVNRANIKNSMLVFILDKADVHYIPDFIKEENRIKLED